MLRRDFDVLLSTLVAVRLLISNGDHQESYWECEKAIKQTEDLQAALVPCPAVASPAWRPMETAPKDGRHVLLIARGGYPDVGRWFDCGVNEVGFWAVHAIRWEPTHWMPLPAPPLPAVRPQEEA